MHILNVLHYSLTALHSFVLCYKFTWKVRRLLILLSPLNFRVLIEKVYG